MGTLKNELSSLFAKMGDDAPNMRKQRRIAEVYERYKGALESVYGDGAQLFLSHTNAVYILRDDGTRRAGAKNGAGTASPSDMSGGARPSATRGTWQPRRNAHGGWAGTPAHAIDGAAETAERLSGGAALPCQPLSETPLVVTAPSSATSTNAENSRPAANVPEASVTGFFMGRPPRLTASDTLVSRMCARESVFSAIYHTTFSASNMGPSAHERLRPSVVSTTHDRHAPMPHAMRRSVETSQGTCAACA